MTNLIELIADLDTLAEAYRRRAGFGQDERSAVEVYNGGQFAYFANAADLLRRAVAAAADREVAALV